MSKRKRLSSPPMGWNSWDCYGAAVNEEQLLGNAAYMAEHLKPYGWEYIVCDIQWYEPSAVGNDYHPFTELCMDEYSRLIPAENRFPSAAGGKGFRPIADKIHEMGLKFGIHILRGIPRQAVHQNTKLLGTDKTARQIAHPFSICAWNTDMYGVDPDKDGAQEYYDSLFTLYASWGVDFVKVDDIANTEFKPHEPYSAKREIEMIRVAMDRCGRDMVLSLSPGPAPVEFAEHLAENADMWRMTGDFWDSWDKLYAMFERCETWYPFVGNGAFPDCDMLPLGRLCKTASYCGDQNRMTRFTKDEQRTMLTLWSIFRSPLILGGELRETDAFTLSLLTNCEVLSLNQNGFGAKPLLVPDDDLRLWCASDAEKNPVVAVFNVGETEKSVCLYDLLPVEYRTCSALHDLWSHTDCPYTKDLQITLPPHASVLYQLKSN